KPAMLPEPSKGRDIAASAVAEIARLANEGQIAMAVESGERAIAKGELSAELLALVGTMHGATLNFARAESCYRKALFLDPTNEDALLHLALLLERRGELALANRLRG